MQIRKITISIIGLLLILTACGALGASDSAEQGEPQEVNEIAYSQPTAIFSNSTNEPSVQSEVAQRSSGGANTNIVVAGNSAVVVAQMPAAPQDPVYEVEEEADLDGEAPDTMQFEDYGVNPFFDTVQDNLSTFAMDVDTGSYTLARSYLSDYSQMPPPESIRAEEFINYFPGQYNAPTGDSAFAINMTASPSPFSEENQILLRVGVQGRIIAPEDRDPALLIFVVDVSGSMDATNRLEMAKDALEILVGELREDDRVGIVIYANEARIVLEPTPASEEQTIVSAINSLRTEGSTYAEAGIALAYQMAQSHMRDNQINRVILLSDGVANVGATGPEAILETVSEGVESGITLSTVGVGMGNYNDVMMEQLANNGNGNYHYVDNIREARRIFVHNLTSTLQVIGYDAKVQVEFNPDVVTRYRLIGYENRDVADELFRDDTVDAGEVGAGHTITALYELELVENVQSGTVATAFLRYQDADSEEVIEMNQAFDMDAILDSFDDMPVDFQLTATVAEFSEILRGSDFGTSSYDELFVVLEPLVQNYPSATEIYEMITNANQLN